MNTKSSDSQNPHPSDLREKFRARLIALGLPPKTHPYLENWAESFLKARAHRGAEKNHSYFAALAQSARLADWQFDQAIQAAKILACDLLKRPWADSFDWDSLGLEAKDPPETHRDFLRETITVDSSPSQPAGPDGLSEAEAVKNDILNRSRKTIRLTGKAVATEK